MEIELRVTGREPLRYVVSGTPLVDSVAPFRLGAGSTSHCLVLEYAPVNALDKVCGYLAIPVATSSGRFSVERLFIPPPPPFTREDVEAMWQEIIGLGLGVPNGINLQGSSEAPAVAAKGRTQRRREDLLGRLAAATSTLITAWPQEAVPAVIWRPVGLAGGVESATLTARQGWRAGVSGRSATLDRVLPARSARRTVGHTGWTSATVSSLARRVSELLRDEYNELPAVLSLIARLDFVAASARPATRTQVEVPPSSWPRPLLDFSTLAWRFLETSILAGTSSTHHVPLCEVWKLYERWIAARVLNSLRETLGDPAHVRPLGRTGDRWMATWSANGYTVTAEAQYRFGKNLGRALPWRRLFRSVTAGLIPDMLIAVEAPEGDAQLLIIDAKEWSTAFGDEGAAAASKYLWGIRGASPEPLSTCEVVLATSQSIGAPYCESEAKMRFLQTSVVDDSALRLVVDDFLNSRCGALLP